MYKRGARVIATTHYPELKAYGYNREGVINASVEFDVETLSPTYKLLIGVPGRSNAFEISKRLGLEENVINHARAHIGEDTNKVENMIASLEESRKKLKKRNRKPQNHLKQAEKLHKDFQKQIGMITMKKDAIVEKAAKEAAQSLKMRKKKRKQIMLIYVNCELKSMQM